MKLTTQSSFNSSQLFIWTRLFFVNEPEILKMFQEKSAFGPHLHLPNSLHIRTSFSIKFNLIYFFSHTRPCLPRFIVPWGLPTKILHAFIVSLRCYNRFTLITSTYRDVNSRLQSNKFLFRLLLYDLWMTNTAQSMYNT